MKFLQPALLVLLVSLTLHSSVIVVAGASQRNFGTCNTLPEGWTCDNVYGLGGSNATIVNGILETDLFAAGAGNDTNYLFATTQKGTFPWSPCQAPANGVLPDNLTSISTTFTPLVLPTTGRYHIYIALYYWLPNGPATSGGVTHQCLDTQSRVESIRGTFSSVGTTATYDPGDSFGWDQVTLSDVSVGATYTLSANVTDQCQGDLVAWGINPTTPCQLAGVEIGIEGFQVDELNVQWTTASFSSAPVLSTPLVAYFNYTPAAPTAGELVNFTSSASGGTPPYVFAWDFGDGGGGTGATASHSYSGGGSFVVNLTATDSSGGATNFQQTVTVSKADTSPPTWPAGSSLSFYGLGPTGVTLFWTPGTDDASVTSYAVYSGTYLLSTIPSPNLSYQVTGLSPGLSYTFHIEAGDAVGLWSTNGPSLTLTTLSTVVSDPVVTSLYFTSSSGVREDYPSLGEHFLTWVTIRNVDTSPHLYNISITQNSFSPTQGGLPLLGRTWDLAPECRGNYATSWILMSTYPCTSSLVSLWIQPGESVNFSFPFVDRWNWIEPWSWQDLVHEVIDNFRSLQYSTTDGLKQIVTQLIQEGWMNWAEHFRFSIYSNQNLLQSTWQEFHVPWTKVAAYIGSLVASQAAAYFSQNGIANLITCILTAGVTCVPLLMESIMIAGQYFSYQAALDPSPDYTTIVQPSALTLTNRTSFDSLPILNTVTREQRTLLQSLAESVIYENATSISLTRYEGAKEAGDDYWAEAQLKAASNYASLRDQYTATFQTDLSALGSTFQPMNQTTIQNNNAYLHKNGLPNLETQVLSGLGLSASLGNVTRGLTLFNQTSLGDPIEDVHAFSTALAQETAFLVSSTDHHAPVWPAGSALHVASVTQTTLRLSWNSAIDDVNVTSYRIYQGYLLLATVSGRTLTYDVTGLSPGTTYTFRVEAGDVAGNWTSNGPYMTISTLQTSPPPPPPPPPKAPPPVWGYVVIGISAVALASVLAFRWRRGSSAGRLKRRGIVPTLPSQDHFPTE
jgi:chitodextrinase